MTLRELKTGTQSETYSVYRRRFIPILISMLFLWHEAVTGGNFSTEKYIITVTCGDSGTDCHLSTGTHIRDITGYPDSPSMYLQTCSMQS